MKKCVFAGTFDPFTTGHESVVNRCLELFDEVVVAILINPEKHAFFSMEERMGFIKKIFGKDKRVRVISYGGIVADLLKEENTKFYVRGIRNSTDYDYETTQTYASESFNKDMIVLYLPTPQKFLHVSSTLVKTCIKFGKPYRDYLPSEIREDVEKIVKSKGEANV